MKTLKEYINEQQVNESFLTVGASILVGLWLAKYAIGAASVAGKAVKYAKKIKEKQKSLLNIPEYQNAVKDLDLLISPYRHKIEKTEYGKLIYTTDFDELIEKPDILHNVELDIKSVLSSDEIKEYDKLTAVLFKYARL